MQVDPARYRNVVARICYALEPHRYDQKEGICLARERIREALEKSPPFRSDAQRIEFYERLLRDFDRAVEESAGERLIYIPDEGET